jgi:hypothetical protein
VRQRLIRALVLLCAASFVARPAVAQAARGRVIDWETKRPIARALVSQIDSSRQVIRAITTDDSGRFVVALPAPGYAAVHVVRLGYAPKTTKWLALDTGDTLQMELEMERTATQLSQVTIRAEREQMKNSRVLGMNVRAFGGVIMPPSQVESYNTAAHDFTDIVRSISIPGVRIIEKNDNTRCVATFRGCMLVFVNDMRVPDPYSALDMIPPGLIDHMIYVRANEAAVLVGTGGDAGVLFIYSKTGKRRP